MKNKKCAECGFINFSSSLKCKKCGTFLSETDDSSNPSKSKGKSIIYNGGISGGVNGAIIIITAIIVCTLSIYWAKQYIPEGNYMIGCFLPFGFFGYVVGVILANILNIIYKQIR